MKEFMLSKVTQTFLKMNYFMDIFQEFRLQILEHLFP